MTPPVKKTRILWLVGCVFAAVSVHSYFHNRTRPAAVETAGRLQEAGRSHVAAIVPERDGNETRLDVYTGTALTSGESIVPPKAKEVVQLSNGSFSVMLPGATAIGAGVMRQSALPDAAQLADAVDGNLRSQPDGVTEVVPASMPNDAPASSTLAPQLTASLRPPARSDAMTKGGLASIQAPAPEAPLTFAAPNVSQRPVARPSSLIAASPDAEPAQPEAEIRLAASSASQELLPAPEPEVAEATTQAPTPANRGRDLSGIRLGKILGLFETTSKRWALVEGEAGRINVLEPGDMIGDGVVSSISNGSMIISVGTAFKEYSAGDRL